MGAATVKALVSSIRSPGVAGARLFRARHPPASAPRCQWPA